MPLFFASSLFILCAIFPFFVYRIVRGPNVYDRLIGLNGIATKAIIFLLLLGAYTRQSGMIVDICLGYGLLNLVGSLAVAKFLETKEIQS